jgi:hypothetical protein
LGPCCFWPVQTWFKHFDHFWAQNCPISDFRRVADLHRWKFVFEWWFSDYSTSKTLKNLFKSFFKQRIIEFTFGKLNLFWRIHISADLNNLLDGWLGVACAII